MRADTIHIYTSQSKGDLAQPPVEAPAAPVSVKFSWYLPFGLNLSMPDERFPLPSDRFGAPMNSCIRHEIPLSDHHH